MECFTGAKHSSIPAETFISLNNITSSDNWHSKSMTFVVKVSQLQLLWQLSNCQSRKIRPNKQTRPYYYQLNTRKTREFQKWTLFCGGQPKWHKHTPLCAATKIYILFNVCQRMSDENTTRTNKTAFVFYHFLNTMSTRGSIFYFVIALC
jgi:hypothetical protein